MRNKVLLVISILLMGLYTGVGGNVAFADAGLVDETVTTSTANQIQPAQAMPTYPYLSLLKSQNIELCGNPQRPVISKKGNFILVPAKDLDYLYYISLNNKRPVLECFTIPTGKGPADVVISKRANRAYVANEQDNSVSIIKLDDEDSETVATIETGCAPYSLSLSEDERYLYVVNRGENTVSVLKLDDEDSCIVNKINVGKWPNVIKMNYTTQKAFVVNRGDNTVTEIDVSDPKGQPFKNVINVGTFPTDLTFSKNGDIVLVTNAMDDNISIFSPIDDPICEFSRIRGLNRPFAAALDYKDNIAAIVNSDANQLRFYDLRYSAQKNVNEARQDCFIIGDKSEFININSQAKIIAVTQPAKNTMDIIYYAVDRRPIEIYQAPITTPQTIPVTPGSTCPIQIMPPVMNIPVR